MKKSVKTVLTASIALVILLTVVSAVSGYFALANDFDHEICHFNVGSVNAALSIILPIAACAVALVCAFLIRKKLVLTDTPAAGIPTVFASVLAGLLMLASAYFALTADGEITNLTTGVAVTAAISGVYLLLLPFMNSKTFMAFLSFVPALWAALKLLEEYFREGEPINSPIRTVNLTMYAFLLLFFCEEIRFFIGRQLVGVYYFCALSALAFTGAASFPKLAVILTGVAGFDFAFIDWCVGTAIFMFILARLTAMPSVLADGDTYEPEHAAAKPNEAENETAADDDAVANIENAEKIEESAEDADTDSESTDE